MTTPDTRFRLSAEGVAEVVAALKSVQAEAQAAARKSGKEFGFLNSVLGKTTQVLGALGIAASVGGIVAFVKNAADAADRTGELAQAVGTTTTKLTALTAVFQLNGVNAERFVQASASMAQKIEELRNGVPAAVGLFKQLGLSTKDFKDKDTADAMALIADKASGMADGLNKTNIASALFGKRIGPQLIASLNQLGGEGGLAGAIKRARELGILLDDEVINAAGRTSDEFTVMQAQSAALATQFVAGLSPAIHQTFELMTKELARTGPAWQRFGTLVGGAVSQLLAGAIKRFDGTTVAIINMGDALKTLGEIMLALAERRLDKVADLWDGMVTRIRKRGEDLFSRQLDRDLTMAAAVPTAAARAAGGAQAPGGTPADAAAKRAALENALIENELKRTQLLLKVQTETEKAEFDRGFANLQDYYSRRRVLIEAAVAAEIHALEAKIEVEKQSAQPNAANLANLKAEVDRLRLQEAADLAALEREKEDARLKLETAKADAALAELDNARARIQAQVTAGTISELEGKRQILALEQGRAANLAEIARLALEEAQASNDPVKIQQAQALVDQVSQLGVAASESQRLIANLDQELGDMLGSALTGALTDAASGMKNLGQVGLAALQSLAAAAARLLAQLIAMRFLQALGLSAAGAGASGAGGGTGERDVGTNWAEGGHVRGPGGPTSDAIAAWLSDNEFVVKARAVARPGMLGVLEAINRGDFSSAEDLVGSFQRNLLPVGVRPFSRGRIRFAEGGLVGGGGAGKTMLGGGIEVGLEEGLVLRHLSAKRGSDHLLKIVHSRRRAFRSALGV